MIEAVSEGDTKSAYPQIGYLATGEALLGVINACVPLLKPVFSKMRKSITKKDKCDNVSDDDRRNNITRSGSIPIMLHIRHEWSRSLGKYTSSDEGPWSLDIQDDNRPRNAPERSSREPKVERVMGTKVPEIYVRKAVDVEGHSMQYPTSTQGGAQLKIILVGTIIDAGSMAQVLCLIVEDFSLLTRLGHACVRALRLLKDDKATELSGPNNEAVETEDDVTIARDHSTSGVPEDHPPLFTSKPLHIATSAVFLLLTVLTLQFLGLAHASKVSKTPPRLQSPGAAHTSSPLPSPSLTATATSTP